MNSVFGICLEKLADIATPLQPYQSRVVERMKEPKRRGLVVAHGLGTGKTLSSIATQDALGQRATVLTPAALQENYQKERTKHLTGKTQPIDLVSLQMAAREGTKLPENPLLIADECFPSGTRISTPTGHQPIQDLSEGDLILALDREGDFVPRRVLRVLRKRTPQLILVKHQLGSVLCTLNHEFLTLRGWVAALYLNSSDGLIYTTSGELQEAERKGPGLDLRRLQENLPLAQTTQNLLQEVRVGNFPSHSRRSEPPLCQRADEAQQSHAPSGSSREDDSHPALHAAQATSAGWQRQTSPIDAADAGRSPGVGNGSGGPDPEEGWVWISDVVQDRHRPQGLEDWHRGGWLESFLQGTARPGSEEGKALVFSRVENLEILERRGQPGPAGLPPDCEVFDLEVEGIHSYVANGCVVHNSHRARDPSSATFQALRDAPAEKKMLLTASPFYNSPHDLAPLINIAAGENVLPNDKTQFDTQYTRYHKVNPGIWGRLTGLKPGAVQELDPHAAKKLKKIYDEYVDYQPGGTEGFPSVSRENVDVPLSDEQLRIYDTVMGQAPAWVARKVKKNLPPSKTESTQMNKFLTGARQASLSTQPFTQAGQPVYSSKIDKAFEHLQAELQNNPNSRAVIYSNFLQGGIEPYAAKLQAAGIPYGQYTGEVQKPIRDQLVRDYNTGQKRVMLLSSAGGEGLDLKGTRLMQILEPHWNQEKLKQVEGRGIRFGSHADLPEADRNVRIESYRSIRPRRGIGERLHLKKPGGAVDEYLSSRSAEKERLNEQFRGLLAQQRDEDRSIPATSA